MQQDSPYAEDLRRLHELAVYCHRVAAPLLEKLPATRESQKKLVTLLESAIAVSGTDFKISKEFLALEVMLSDRQLLDTWSASPVQLAWLMVHENLSDFFVRYAIQRWDPETFLVHHVPKAAGTSVYAFLARQQYFVAFPQTYFGEMCKTYGMLGFSRQVVMFEKDYRQERLYVGGHYNLPDTVQFLKLFGRCQGVTLCRPPLEIMSSAVRYIWTMIENGEAAGAQLYGVHGVDGAELKRLREALIATGHVERRVPELLMAIMASAQFRSEYDEILVKYFYNREIGTPTSLCAYMKDCGKLSISLHPRHDAGRVLASLKVDGILPHANASIFPEKHLFDAVGGAQAFAAIVEPRMRESTRIYEAMVEMRAA